MQFFKRLIDLLTLGSERPVRRLIAYYAFLGAIAFILYQFVPAVHKLFAVVPAEQLPDTPQILQDGLVTGASTTTVATSPEPRLDFAISTLIAFMSVIALMLPVSWVYMSVGKDRRHSQAVAQTLLMLPLVVAGVVLIVQNSLALAFSLAGVVAAVRFRTTLSDTRETVFIFLAIAVGFAAGVQVLTVAVILSVLFNVTLLFIWRYDFGRNVLEPSASAQWTEPLSELAKRSGSEQVPDRDLVLALTPKKVDVLAERFNRINKIMGSNGSKPRYNAVTTIRTSKVTEAQRKVETALDASTKRWRLDEVITNTGKPSTIHYLVKTRRSVGRDGLITAIRSSAAGVVDDIDVELGDTAVKEREKAGAS
jgi:hypothetical protein